MAALKSFLFDHLGHPLVFSENCESEVADWDEIEARPEPPLSANNSGQTAATSAAK